MIQAKCEQIRTNRETTAALTGNSNPGELMGYTEESKMALDIEWLRLKL